jgi:hypothetical protein
VLLEDIHHKWWISLREAKRVKVLLNRLRDREKSQASGEGARERNCVRRSIARSYLINTFKALSH